MNQLLNSATLPKPKPHFALLDGMRGVAALAVVIFHFMEWVYPESHQNVLGHGFLAVDFFFCLSGFVIGYAYDERLSSLGIWAFFKARLIRLHPLVVLGSVLGLLAFLFAPPGSVSQQLRAGQSAASVWVLRVADSFSGAGESVVQSVRAQCPGVVLVLGVRRQYRLCLAAL